MNRTARIFKTAWFTKAARKAGIDDASLRLAVVQAMQGQAVDLGDGVFKKRLNQNRHRAIVLAKNGQNWVLEYLFAKNDRANISRGELLVFRKLAGVYASLDDEQIQLLLDSGEWTEIEHV